MTSTDMTNGHLRNLTARLGVLILLGLPACSDDGSDDAADTGTETDTGGDEPLAIIGEYMDDFGDTHTITMDAWQNSAGSFAISDYDNAAMYLIAQNASTNPFNPDLWSRFDWTSDGDQLYYCQSVFDAATPEDAEAGSADAMDLEMGCGGFPWSMLTPL